MTESEARARAVNALTNMATIINSGGGNTAIYVAWVVAYEAIIDLFIVRGIELPEAPNGLDRPTIKG